MTERRMFGGLAFMVGGHMAVAASGRGGLMVRAAPEEAERLIDAGPAEPMIMRGRPASGWLRVAGEHLQDEGELARWTALGVNYARALRS